MGLYFCRKQLAIIYQLSLLSIKWTEENVLNLLFKNQKLNCVTMIHGLQNLTATPYCLQKLKRVYRVLKLDSQVILLDLHRS
jgi:ubiquinone/menaquinone biosynthesis C-methylase UbiE